MMADRLKKSYLSQGRVQVKALVLKLGMGCDWFKITNSNDTHL